MQVLRPQVRPIDLEGWFLKNFDPGIMTFLREELALSEQELQVEHRIWRAFTTGTIPEFFPGFVETLQAFRRRGGIVTVVSHSERDVILKAYGSALGGRGFIPDLVFGWDYEESRRKPSPWPVHQILKRFALEPAEVLIVDDLKPGVLMSRAAGVPVAGAGWAHSIAPIRRYMRESCDVFFETVEAFRQFLR